MYEQLQLHVVRIAEHQRRSVAGVDDPRMGYLVRVQLAGPSVQFVAVGYLKRQMIEADPTFVERSQIRRRAVGHQSHRETRRVKHGSALKRCFVDGMDQGEAEDVVPP